MCIVYTHKCLYSKNISPKIGTNKKIDITTVASKSSFQHSQHQKSLRRRIRTCFFEIAPSHLFQKACCRPPTPVWLLRRTPRANTLTFQVRCSPSRSCSTSDMQTLTSPPAQPAKQIVAGMCRCWRGGAGAQRRRLRIRGRTQGSNKVW